jgi:uncharacterized protein (TIGR01777 family)
MIGSRLSKSLSDDGHEVIVLSRTPRRNQGPDHSGNGSVRQVKWDAETAKGWGELADGAQAIVNLAGENLGESRWSEERKRRIYTSRANAGRAVIDAVTAATAKPEVVIQPSGTGYYGPRDDEVITEESSPGSDFLAQVCFDWESSTAAVEAMGVRRAVMRSGMVLSNDGGAWPRILLPYKFFVGGTVGSGKQYWPWIHIDDQVRVIRFLIDNPNASGVFNVCTPSPLTAKEFATTLGKVMGRPALFPVPSFALKTVFGEMSTVLLDGQRTVPKRLQELGFTFKYPTAEGAFADLT